MRSGRKSTYFLTAMTALAILFVVTTIHAWVSRSPQTAALTQAAGMVKEAGLTDLCLFNEASYTRNPSQTDLQTPFQEHPMSLEHFPSGSLMPPPEHRK